MGTWKKRFLAVSSKIGILGMSNRNPKKSIPVTKTATAYFQALRRYDGGNIDRIIVKYTKFPTQYPENRRKP